MSSPASHRGRRDNGLDSDKFSPVADVDPRLADHLLDVLGLRDVPAYVEPTTTSDPVTADRLYVAADQTSEARQVLTEIASELGIEVAQHRHWDRPGERAEPPADPLAGIDTDAEFAKIIAELQELNRPVAAPPDPAPPRQLGTAAVDPLDQVEHFVPPPAPPVPRPALPTAMAVLVTLLGVLVLAFGYPMGLPPDLPLPLGVVLVLFGSGLLVLRLRPEPRDDSDDDGAVV
ncbi:MAG: hypothetical protein QOE23_2604 [Pseudonocardiales bacterium]|nr:hypothetical protein [Pseudonocardiales bacterium]